MSCYRERHEDSDEALRERAKLRRMFFAPDTDAADIAIAVKKAGERAPRNGSPVVEEAVTEFKDE